MGNIYDTIEDYLKYKNNYKETFKEEYESKFVDYRNEDVDEIEKYINEIK